MHLRNGRNICSNSRNIVIIPKSTGFNTKPNSGTKRRRSPRNHPETNVKSTHHMVLRSHVKSQ